MGLEAFQPAYIPELRAEDALMLVDAEVFNPRLLRMGGIGLRAIVDTGSFITIIPERIVQKLSLISIGGFVSVNPIRFESPMKPPARLPKMQIQIKIRTGGDAFVTPVLWAVSARRDDLILGRDVLRWFSLHYYGAGALNAEHSTDRLNPLHHPGVFEIGGGPRFPLGMPSEADLTAATH